MFIIVINIIIGIITRSQVENQKEEKPRGESREDDDVIIIIIIIIIIVIIIEKIVEMWREGGGWIQRLTPQRRGPLCAVTYR